MVCGDKVRICIKQDCHIMKYDKMKVKTAVRLEFHHLCGKTGRTVRWYTQKDLLTDPLIAARIPTNRYSLRQSLR